MQVARTPPRGNWHEHNHSSGGYVNDDGPSRVVAVVEGRIERFDTAILKPQRTELGGFILVQGTKEQIDALRDDHDFARWATQIQLVADKVGIVDARVNPGVPDAIGL